MNGKPPAFLFYAADWLTDTAELSKEEKGIYIDLLAYEWVNGDLPTDFTRLARLISCDQAMLEAAWMFIGEKFVQIADSENSERTRFVNPRLEEEREILLERRAARSRAGKIGGIASSAARSKRSTIASSKRTSKNERSEDKDKDEDKDEIKAERDAHFWTLIQSRFDRWWSVWPKKIAKERARKVFFKIAPSDEVTEKMIRTTILFSGTEDWMKEKRRFVPNPDKWLRGEQWEDEIETTVDELALFCRERDIPVQ